MTSGRWTPAKAVRAGWGLTAERVVKGPAGLDLPAVPDRIEAEWGPPTPSCSGR